MEEDLEELIEADPIAKAVSLIPVGLKEAALDSPSFRAAVIHFTDQFVGVERWLDCLVKSIGKLSQELLTFENLINTFFGSLPPPMGLSEAILDPDYAALASKRCAESSREFWASSSKFLKRIDANMAEPLRKFLNGDMLAHKELRRQLDLAQKNFDSAQARYSSQARTKESSALREDAFQLHEAKKAYLKASLDFACSAPQLKLSLDKIIVKVMSDQAQSIDPVREKSLPLFTKWNAELERIRGWSRETEASEGTFRQELHSARTDIENSAEAAARPSRELEDYSQHSAASRVNLGAPSATIHSPTASSAEIQGWLNLKTITGKPAKTVWSRRWFYIRAGVFGWLVQSVGGVKESERIGVLLCSMRPAQGEERRFCFEIKTKDTTIILQADSQAGVGEWTKMLNAAKRKALETPSSAGGPGYDNSVDSYNQDLAFAISPPSASEFAASPADVTIHTEEGHEKSLTFMSPPVAESGSTHRGSFDVTSGRRSATFETDVAREQAARLMQKLDLHRKPVSGNASSSQTVANNSSVAANPTGGVASLISASHMTLPLGSSTLSQASTSENAARNTGQSGQSALTQSVRKLPLSDLAPATFANPPNATTLSATAILVAFRNAMNSSNSQKNIEMESGITANLWGSCDWGHMNKLEHRDVHWDEQQNMDSRITTQKTDTSSALKDGQPTDTRGRSQSTPEHQSSTSEPHSSGLISSPISNYPLILKYQNAQFHLLFSQLLHTERPLFVFRAIWTLSEQQQFPGRVYVTMTNMYFYSHHLGLVLTAAFPLNTLSETTAASGRDCDYLFLHLKGAEGSHVGRITLKTFIEPLKVVQRRLGVLIRDQRLIHRQDLEATMRALTKVEDDGEDSEKSLILDDDEQPSTRARSVDRRKYRDLSARILVDGGLSNHMERPIEKDPARFKLPNKPVIYTPRGTSHPIVETEFDISPKALFYIMFGDRNPVWHVLYKMRRSDKIRIGKWTQEEGQHWRREIEYTADARTNISLTQRTTILDSQTIDVLSQHLCYVATDRKIAWHLPYHRRYELVSKIVITHVAKSRCKLAIYPKIEWSNKPVLLASVLEKRALKDIRLDALDLTDMMTEEVRKLGSTGQTKQALRIFGGIGERGEDLQHKYQNPELGAHTRQPVKQTTLTLLVADAIASFTKDITNIAVMWLLAIVTWTWKTVTANRVIIVALLISFCFNFLLSMNETVNWFSERRAGHLLKGLVTNEDLVMTRAIALTDLEDATSNRNRSENEHGECLRDFPISTFGDIPQHTSYTLKRLHKTRRRLSERRYQLAIAMRVMNRVEAEIIRIEREHWLDIEIEKCEEVRKVLLNGGHNLEDPSKLHNVRSLLEDYCSACRKQRKES